MRKIPLAVIAFYARLVCSFAQIVPEDSTNYEARKLKIDEVNFVSGYYQQDGHHSGVTGGIGTENLTDFANTIELKMSKISPKGNLRSWSFEAGVDIYTSASSDNIDPIISVPSRQDMRIYPSLSYSSENLKKGITLGAGLSYSHEYDYESRGVNLSLVKSSQDKNTEFGLKLLAYFDSWSVIYPIELRNAGIAGGINNDNAGYLPRNSYQASFIFTRVISDRMQVALLFDPAYQQGQLTTLYQRVYFNDNSERVEKLPGTRVKIPAAIRANYFSGNYFIIRGYYRFYYDDWGNIAHTTDLEIPVKITPFFSLSPFYRFSQQSGIDYFAPFKGHHINESFYTSDYDLSPFTSHFIGIGVRFAPPTAILGSKYWNVLELRFGHYLRSTGLSGNSLTLALKFK